MKYLFFMFLFTGTLVISAQESLNAFKYIIVPKHFDSFKRQNQYQTSTLVKYLLVRNGFNAVYDDQLPEELNMNRCLGLLVELLDDSSMFATKTTLTFKDCNTKEVFRTLEGSSKIKEYKEAYQEALTETFQSFEGFTYAYTPAPANSGPVSATFENDVKDVDKETAPPVPPAVADKAVLQESSPEQQSYKDLRPVPSAMEKATENSSKLPGGADESVPGGILYAQEIPDGFQLVDNEPSVRLKLYKSSLTDVFIAQNESTNGLVFRKGDQWVYEYYEGGQLRVKMLNIKF